MKQELKKSSKSSSKTIPNEFDWIDAAHWNYVNPYRGKAPMSEEDLYVAISKKETKEGISPVIRFRIGTEVMEKLNWNIGDKLNFCTHKDDLLLITLFKSELGNGWTITKESKSEAGRAVITWQGAKIPMNETAPFQMYKLKYSIYKNNLIFRLEQNANN